MKIVWLSWRSYVGRGWGVALIGAPTAILFGLVTLLITIQGTLAAMTAPGIDDRAVRVEALAGRFSLPAVRAIAGLPHVADVSPVYDVPCTTPDERRGQLPNCVGAGSAMAQVFGGPPPDELARWNRDKNGIIVAARVAERFGWQVGHPVSLPLAAGGTAEVTVSSLAPDDFPSIYLHAEYADELTGRKGEVDRLWLLVDAPANRNGVMEAIVARFEGSTSPARTFPAEVAKAGLLSASRLLVAIFRIAGLLAVALTLFSALATLTLSVDARRRELATLRAIGYRRIPIALVILLESVFLLAPGALVGGAAMFFLFHRDGVPLSPQVRLHFTLLSPLLAAALGVIVAVTGALLPALRAATANVLDALRS